MRATLKYLGGVMVLAASQVFAIADTPTQIEVRVIDHRVEPVENARVRVRYLASVWQDGVEYQVPMELASPQTTDREGLCKLTLHDVPWKLAGIHAFRPELTTDELSELYDRRPTDPEERREFEREVADRSARFSVAYQLLPPETKDGSLVLVELSPAMKVTARVLVDGKPLARAFVTLYSQDSAIDQLFARWSPQLTDEEGRLRYYATPGDLDLAKIVVERPGGNWVLNLTDVPSKADSTGREFQLDTDRKSYALIDPQVP